MVRTHIRGEVMKYTARFSKAIAPLRRGLSLLEKLRRIEFAPGHSGRLSAAFQLRAITFSATRYRHYRHPRVADLVRRTRYSDAAYKHSNTNLAIRISDPIEGELRRAVLTITEQSQKLLHSNATSAGGRAAQQHHETNIGTHQEGDSRPAPRRDALHCLSNTTE